MLQFRAGLFRRRGPRCEVDRAILCGDLASHCQDRPCPGGKFRGDDSERVGLALDHLRGTIFAVEGIRDRNSTRLNSSHQIISYAVFCLKKKKKILKMLKLQM